MMIMGSRWMMRNIMMRMMMMKKLPFMMSWLEPSMAPLVPSSANRKASRCFGWRGYGQVAGGCPHASGGK